MLIGILKPNTSLKRGNLEEFIYMRYGMMRKKNMSKFSQNIGAVLNFSYYLTCLAEQEVVTHAKRKSNLFSDWMPRFKEIQSKLLLATRVE